MIWKAFCNLNPNYSDYFRNSAWAICSSLLLTLGIKFESWEWFPLILLTMGLICFIIAASYLTFVSNFIKRHQTRYNDLKLITRAKNNYEEEGVNLLGNIFNEMHIHEPSEKNEKYPDFLNFYEYLDNVSTFKKEKEKKYPDKLGYAIFFVVVGFIVVISSAIYSKIDKKPFTVQEKLIEALSQSDSSIVEQFVRFITLFDQNNSISLKQYEQFNYLINENDSLKLLQFQNLNTILKKYDSLNIDQFEDFIELSYKSSSLCRKQNKLLKNQIDTSKK
ncbi:MAG TPA: hypothetical protein VFF33_13480 [Ignavibacteriaceae bacterium]|nr:hypothetical protein [Ignavibacteriaceae bacterium]